MDDRRKAILKAYNRLKEYEKIALPYYFLPEDMSKIDPWVRIVSNDRDDAIYTYFRFMVSSEPQSLACMWKNIEIIVYDKNSWCMLWVAQIKNNRSIWNEYVNYFWTDRVLMNMESNHIYQLWRCLPLQPFGKYLWWKLIALMATSKEVCNRVELKYSLTVWWYTIKSLHWKASQYSQLESRNIEMVWEFNQWWYYFCKMKKWLDRFMRWEVWEKKLKNCAFSIRENADYWKERFFLPRLERMKEEWIQYKVDREKYSLNYVLTSKNTL